ncbi:DUF1848 domain-containing protein [Desulfocurvibacter africanus]|uniref:DNA repair photolyase n=1 Tax=Desulfocurvibacter africanus subsp. africanus str. Walvis Bay TaxID=690850 RepID=F3YVM4_DESAF|nr:DUF1848 domain-containing protein [Desulfocurvibacter africanus]EGJ48760.1 protein of unknown function DUF1848 [Desulfocurvibacter africanus subsp. africanus str. Walvis Bay]
MRWPRVDIDTPHGPRQAIAPAVITASRATDIPAFHSGWMLNRLAVGWCRWDNPFGGPAQYVSFARLRAVVLFTKNPRPGLGLLRELERRSLPFYIHVTLNDYETEGWEPGLPSLGQRVQNFAELSHQLGRERVIWRFDPLLCSEATPPPELLRRLESLCERLHAHTERFVFSFAHLERYAKVRRNLAAAGVRARSFTTAEMRDMAGRIADLCRVWGLAPTACGEELDFTDCGIERGRCVDPALLLRLAPDDAELARLYGPRRTGQGLLPGAPGPAGSPKDAGQRKACGCAPAKDIGGYTTCGHGCVYCYANSSPDAGRRNAARVDAHSEALKPGGAESMG